MPRIETKRVAEALLDVFSRGGFPTEILSDKGSQFTSEPSIEKALLILHVTTETHFLLQKNLKNVMYGLVKMYVMRCPFCLTIFFIRFGTKLYR